MGWDELAVDEENTGEAHGTVQVASVLIADPLASADTTAGSASDLSRKCLAGLSAPTGLFASDDLKELRQGTWTGHGDRWFEVVAARWNPLQGEVPPPRPASPPLLIPQSPQERPAFVLAADAVHPRRTAAVVRAGDDEAIHAGVPAGRYGGRRDDGGCQEEDWQDVGVSEQAFRY